MLFTADFLERRGKRIPLAAKMPPFSGHTIVLRTPSWDDFLARPAASNRRRCRSIPKHARFLLYTSGTTGKPKGTVHTHAGCLAQMGKEIWLGFDHRDDDRFFWLSDIGWMMGPWTILGNHLFGGTIFLYDGAPDYPEPGAPVGDDRAPPHHHFRRLADRHPHASKSAGELPPMESLRLLGSTGEPWDDTSWLWFFERVGRRRCPIINISGGTEIVGSFLFPLPIQALKPCTLGAPAPGMATEVVDENGVPGARAQGLPGLHRARRPP